VFACCKYQYSAHIAGNFAGVREIIVTGLSSSWQFQFFRQQCARIKGRLKMKLARKLFLRFSLINVTSNMKEEISQRLLSNCCPGTTVTAYIYK